MAARHYFLTIAAAALAPATVMAQQETEAPMTFFTLVPATMTVQACIGNFIRGDCNNNGQVGGSLGDPVASLKFLFLGTFSPPCINACDFNDDGAVSVQDAVNQFGWMFQSGTGPPPPTPTGAAFPGDCGPDPTAGSLTCQSNICP